MNDFIVWISEIQYLSWMLNNIFCLPEEKDSWKHVYIVYFFMYISVRDEKKRQN